MKTLHLQLPRKWWEWCHILYHQWHQLFRSNMHSKDINLQICGCSAFFSQDEQQKAVFEKNTLQHFYILGLWVTEIWQELCHANLKEIFNNCQPGNWRSFRYSLCSGRHDCHTNNSDNAPARSTHTRFQVHSVGHIKWTSLSPFLWTCCRFISMVWRQIRSVLILQVH